MFPKISIITFFCLNFLKIVVSFSFSRPLRHADEIEIEIEIEDEDEDEDCVWITTYDYSMYD